MPSSLANDTSAARWSVKPIPQDELAALRRSDLAAEVPDALLKILAQRGFGDPESARDFLFPRLAALSDPFLIPDMRAAVDRLFEAIDNEQSVVLYGDYDVDGVTSLTLLTTILRAYGLNPIPFLPHRMEEGYGISVEGLKRCFETCKPDLLIAVDCGTTSHKELRWLAEQEVDSIVLDHHELSPEGRPECVQALVNPKAQIGCEFTYLCTAGLAFKIAHALLKERRLEGFDLKAHLDIAAVGTVADIVPLVGENRILVRHGLSKLENSVNPGLNALKVVAGVAPPIGAQHIGFRIGPRLNAAGRLDSAQASLDLLLSGDNAQAVAFAESLDTQNRERQSVEQRIREEAWNMLPAPGDPETPAGLVAGSRGWHPGVVGIVASRVMNAHHRPAFIIAVDEDGVGKGSGRSIPGISLVAAIDHCRDLLIKGGGHEMAAGISIMEENIEEFSDRFAQFIEAAAEKSEDDLLTRKIVADAEITFAEIGFKLLNYNDLLEPVGAHNPAPLFLSRNVRPTREPRELKEKHLKFSLVQGGEFREAIFFNRRLHELPPAPWDIAFKVERNVYRERTSVQIQIQEIRAAVAD